VSSARQAPTGRGTPLAPGNRFERTVATADWEQLDADEQQALVQEPRRVATQFLPDAARSIIAENNSPDVPFRYSINPYRGCEHGCVYCYARPTHEYLGYSAGLDFETRILVKHEAAALLRADLNRPAWRGEHLAISGVTDCYQPVERELRLTRGLWEVLTEARQAAGAITKNALVVRDLDLLVPLAEQRLAHVFLSVTTLDAELARTMEPRTSRPQARLRAVRALADAGVPVGVMVAPIIPGLNDREVPAILEAARAAGARSAGYVMLRLPYALKEIFLDWLRRARPLAAESVEARIRDTRGGELSETRFGRRMRGAGEYAEQIARTFEIFRRKLGLEKSLPPLDESQFRPPLPPGGQQTLF
jgi:DNA repair photolyase